MNVIDWQLEELEEFKNLINFLDIETTTVLELTADVVGNEFILQEMVSEIRSKWLIKVANLTARYNLIPWKGQIPIGLYGEEIKYTYERLLEDAQIAKRFQEKSYMENQQIKTVLYNSGMSAIRGTIDIIDAFLKEPLNIIQSVGYFESCVYMESLKNKGISVSELDLDDENKRANVFFFEPIRYSIEPEVSDVERLIEKIDISNAKIIFVIMDSTMHGSTRLLEYIDKHMQHKKNIVFIDIRSGIKMDQLGLEIANLGIVTWYIRTSNINPELFMNI